MLDNCLEGLHLILQWQNLLAILIGVYCGVIIGMLPGLSPAMAVALAAPFTLFIPPLQGLSLLMGIYKGGVYGGSISAVLIGTPGTPEAAATVFDGYALTKKGKAERALYASLYASIFGDVMGTTVLMFLSPLFAAFALMVGPAETIPLVLLALSIIIVTLGNEKVKGFIAALIGFILATVGVDPIAGSTRLTFDSLELAIGIGIIPLLIGLFAIPEIISNVLDKSSIDSTNAAQGKCFDLGHDQLTVREFFAHWKLFIMSGVIGAVIGAMPGLGSATASFTCYAAAQKMSKKPELFGHGSEEGLIACETGNNGTVGPALVPLLTLGIPGSATAAVLYGSLIMNGITPGPFIFRDHGSVLYGLFIGLMIGAVVLYPVAISVFKYLIIHILKIDKRFLFAAVFLLCVSGAYAVQNSMTDVFVMCIAGIFAFPLKRLGFPMGPLLIAFILEPILERSSRESLLLAGNNLSEVLLSSQISISLWCVLLAIPVFLTIKYLFKK